MGTIQSIYLFQLARDKSAEGRKTFAKAISGVFQDHYPSLTKSERTIMFDILHHLVHDVEMALRRVISEQLAELDDVPHMLAKVLANDDIEVAFPILSLSTVLLDDDLIEIIHERTVEHQLAVTQRPSVSEVVSDVLVEKDNEKVICSLLTNSNASISSTTINYLAEESKRITAYQGPILRREDLDPDLAKRMFTWVSAALRQYILDNHDLDQEYVDQVIENSVLDEFKARSQRARNRGASEVLADELNKGRELTPELMVQALQDGEVRLFVAMFHRLTGVPKKIVGEMLADREGTGLAIACKADGLGKAVFSAIYVCGRKAHEGGDKGLRGDIRRLLGLYDRMSVEAAGKVAGRWKQNVSYRAAVRELELS